MGRYKDYKLGIETINIQLNDKHIKEVENHLGEMLNIVNGILMDPSRFGDTVIDGGIIRDDNLIAIKNRIEKLLTKRFGFNIKLFFNKDKTFYTHPISLPTNKQSIYNYYDENMYNNMVDDDINFLKNYEQIKNVLDNNYHDIDIKAKLGENAYIGIVKLNLASILYDLKNSNIVIDNNRAYISGLPKEFTVIISMDIVHALNNFTQEELMAILLHELGHNYTLIEYSYKVHRTSITIDSSIREYLKYSTTKSGDILRYVYNKTAKEEPKSNDVIKVFAELLNVIDKELYLTYGYNMSNKNSEILADTFTNRFGYGKHEVTALNKVINREFSLFSLLPYENRATKDIYKRMLSLIGLCTNNYFYALIMKMLNKVLYVKALIKSICKYKRNEQTITDSNYELDVKRFDRIKKDIIRMIRIYGKDMSKDMVNCMINNIKEIDNIIEDLKEVSVINSNLYNKITNFVFGRNTDKQLAEIENIVENLIENKLHYLTHEL